MKSKVQTYDIRDCEEYFGVLELEQLLKKANKENNANVNLDMIRRSSSKVYKIGSKLNVVEEGEENTNEVG